MSNNTCLTHFETFKIKLTHHLSNFQLVTLVTYIYFIFTVIGRQKIHGYGPGNGPIHEFMRSGRIPLEMDLYFPLFTILQLFFYMGLLKVRKSNQFNVTFFQNRFCGVFQQVKALLTHFGDGIYLQCYKNPQTKLD